MIAVISVIVAVADNGVIGSQGRLPWQVSADLRRFKRLTMGHHLILGRTTYEAVGRPLPGRTMVVVTRDESFEPGGVLVAHSIHEAFALSAGDDEVFVGGGAEVYRQTIDLADRLYLTRIHGSFAGDAYFVGIDSARWRLVSSEAHGADDRNSHPYTFEDYVRRKEVSNEF